MPNPTIPTPGRIVLYQTDGRNGLDYELPAIVTVTRDSHPGDYPDGKPNSLLVPTSKLHVHLTVFTPGGFGSTYVADGVESGYNQDGMPNLGRPDSFVPGSGSYVEYDVPHHTIAAPPLVDVLDGHVVHGAPADRHPAPDATTVKRRTWRWCLPHDENPA